MLVLSRNINESIIVNDNIVIKVIDVRGSQIRIGIEAPKHISVHREEIHQKILNTQNVITDEVCE